MDAGGSQKTKPRSTFKLFIIKETRLYRPFCARCGVFPLCFK